MNIALFEAIADLLIPAGRDMPSASQAQVGTIGLAQVLRFRPELEGPLGEILDRCERGSRGRSPSPATGNREGERPPEPLSPQQALASLDPAAASLLAEVVASAYFMNEEVRAKLHYQGQRAQPIVPEEIDPALLKPVLDRGPIYRQAV